MYLAFMELACPSNLIILIIAVVEEIGERFGQFQDGGCKRIGTKVIRICDQWVGRVPLQDFLGPPLNGTSVGVQQFFFSKEFGVLDCSETAIDPNYVVSRANGIVSLNLWWMACHIQSLRRCEACQQIG